VHSRRALTKTWGRDRGGRALEQLARRRLLCVSVCVCGRDGRGGQGGWGAHRAGEIRRSCRMGPFAVAQVGIGRGARRSVRVGYAWARASSRDGSADRERAHADSDREKMAVPIARMPARACLVHALLGSTHTQRPRRVRAVLHHTACTLVGVAPLPVALGVGESHAYATCDGARFGQVGLCYKVEGHGPSALMGL
jgi:hypothetical protein